MIQSFERTIGGKVTQLCVSLGEGSTPYRVIISLADSAKTLVVLDASGLLGTLKAEIEEPEKLIANAVAKVQNEGLIERAIDSGTIQEASLEAARGVGGYGFTPLPPFCTAGTPGLMPKGQRPLGARRPREHRISAISAFAVRP